MDRCWYHIVLQPFFPLHLTSNNTAIVCSAFFFCCAEQKGDKKNEGKREMGWRYSVDRVDRFHQAALSRSTLALSRCLLYIYFSPVSHSLHRSRVFLQSWRPTLSNLTSFPYCYFIHLSYVYIHVLVRTAQLVLTVYISLRRITYVISYIAMAYSFIPQTLLLG